MKEGIIKDTYELIIKEIQTIITIFYIIVVGIGMIFNYHKFSEFDIKIFNYSDVFDFLIAPFSDFVILLFAITSILAVLTLFKLDIWWEKNWPKSYSKLNFGRNKKSWYNTYRIIMALIILIFYLNLSADIYGKYTKKKIIGQKEITIRLADNEIKSGKLIGKTKDVIFLLKDKSVYAIPLTSLVKEIKIK